MDIIYLQMVNASRKNLKAHSPFLRLSPLCCERIIFRCAPACTNPTADCSTSEGVKQMKEMVLRQQLSMCGKCREVARPI
jgi:hypothetical protein